MIKNVLYHDGNIFDNVRNFEVDCWNKNYKAFNTLE